MDQYASKSEATYWLEKTPAHTTQVHRLSSFYPDSRFVAIKRNVSDVVLSGLNLARVHEGKVSKVRSAWIIVGTLSSYIYYNKSLYDYMRHADNMMMVQYEEMLNDPARVLRSVCNFLSIPFSEEMERETFPANTSYTTAGSPSRNISAFHRKLLELAVQCGSHLPYRGMQLVDRSFRMIRGRRSLPPWFFKLHDLGDPSSHIHTHE